MPAAIAGVTQDAGGTAGAGSEVSPLVGVWECTGVTRNGVDQPDDPALGQIWQFNPDGTATLTVYGVTADGSPPPPGSELIYVYTWEVTGAEIDLSSVSVNGRPLPPPPGDRDWCSYHEGETAAPPPDECRWVVDGDTLTVYRRQAEGAREVHVWTRQ